MSDNNNLCPRLCVIKRWADFAGYGFNLHAERGRAGQYIGKVDDNSPAQAAGLKEGDRIVEVNGTNIGNENHSQVVTRIKAGGDVVSLLVVDSETDQHYKEEKVVVSGNSDEVIRLETPPQPGTEEQEEDLPLPREDPPTYHEVQQDDEAAGPPTPERTPTPEPVREPTPEPVRDPTPEPTPEPYRDPTPEPRVPTPEPEVTVTVNSIAATPSPYNPRLCHLIKYPDFQGYGFNLHADKDKKGQNIGMVDDGSPAADAGLLEGDRIIEVDGVNIEDASHPEVIQRIKAGGDETTLLVVDPSADEYYKNNGIQVSSDMPEVIANSSKVKVKEVEVPEVHVPAVTYTPRYCHIIKWHDFSGYGFNLHAAKERGAQHIGQIDDHSPAQDAQLYQDDRIIEVNGVNIENETHKEVISRIKAGGDETRLLVVDKEADAYYKSRGITVTGNLPEVKHCQTTRRSPPAVANGEPTPAPAPIFVPDPVTVSQTHIQEAPRRQVQANGDDPFSGMSAKELREKLAQKKKRDPKQNTGMDFRSKFEIFQKM